MKIKKLLAAVMTGAMVVGTLCTGAFAADDDPTSATGATVWCVDIDGLATALGCGSADLDSSATAADKQALAEDAGLSITDVTIIADGEEIAVSEYYFGDIEANGKIRIEIRNQYGTITEGYEDLTWEDTLAVRFTIAGVPDGEYEAFEMYTDSAWAFGNWTAGDDANDATYITEQTATITGDGTYTVSISNANYVAEEDGDDSGEGSATLPVVFAAVAALAVVATVSTKKFAER